MRQTVSHDEIAEVDHRLLTKCGVANVVKLMGCIRSNKPELYISPMA